MKTSTAALAGLFVAAVLCYQVSSSPISLDFLGPCCIQYIPKELPSKRVVSYEYTGSHCFQPAVIFTTVKGKKVCGKLSDKWVQDLVSQQKDRKGSG